MTEKISSGEIVFGADESRIIRKIYLSDQTGRVPPNLWIPEDVGGTREANRELKDLFGTVFFDTPKPTRLISRMIEISVSSGSDECIVLDFFAGSGTTAHAALANGPADAGLLKFILVQLPEPTGRDDYPTIAEITKERVRRVIQKLNEKDSDKLDLDPGQRPDRGFRVFKLDESNFTTWEADASGDATELARQLEMHVDHIRPGRTDEDLLHEILLKSGFPLTTPIETLELEGKAVHSVAEGALLVCLERNLTLELIRAMAGRTPARVVCLDEGFAQNDQLKANAVQIFKSKGVTSFRTV